MRKKNSWLRPWRRHSTVLLVAGLVYVGIGYAYIVSVPTPERLDALYFARFWLDLNTWGYVWMFIGLCSIISARWPPASEKWGYTMLTGQSSAWAGFYLAGVWFHDTPISNYTAFATWALIAFMWWAISGLVNPEDEVARST